MDRVIGTPQRRALRIHIGKAVQWHRLRRGYTQSELADAANLSLKYVGQVERGSANVSIAVIERLAAVLDWNPLEAMEGVRQPLAEGVRDMMISETALLRERLDAMLAWLRATDPALVPVSSTTTPRAPRKLRRRKRTG
jgi:transcriptional regulator with XRE-family HTH domain